MCRLGGLAGLAEVGERPCLDRGLGNAGVGEPYAELFAALRIVVPAQWRVRLRVRGELGRGAADEVVGGVADGERRAPTPPGSTSLGVFANREG